MTDTERESAIDAFLAGWGGLKQTRELARYYLEESNWNVKAAQDAYWRENILIY